MSRILRDMTADTPVGIVAILVCGHHIFGFFKTLLLVLFQGYNIVRLLLYDFFCYFRLAAHRINSDYAVLKFQSTEQWRDGSDFIAFVIHLHLS